MLNFFIGCVVGGSLSMLLFAVLVAGTERR
jgi:hypothetical protein